MAKERLKSPRARLFVALDLPERVRLGIDDWGETALADPALRRVPPESLHITLAFLGHRPEKEIEEIAAVVGESVEPAPWIELQDPVQRPPRGRARMFVLPALAPSAEDLQAGLQRNLVEARLHEPEKRPWWPHVTLARVRPEGRGSRRPRAVEMAPGSLPATLLEPFLGVRVTLYRSELEPQGARYVPLAQIELPQAGRQ